MEKKKNLKKDEVIHKKNLYDGLEQHRTITAFVIGKPKAFVIVVILLCAALLLPFFKAGQAIVTGNNLFFQDTLVNILTVEVIIFFPCGSIFLYVRHRGYPLSQECRRQVLNAIGIFLGTFFFVMVGFILFSINHWGLSVSALDALSGASALALFSQATILIVFVLFSTLKDYPKRKV